MKLLVEQEALSEGVGHAQAFDPGQRRVLLLVYYKFKILSGLCNYVIHAGVKILFMNGTKGTKFGQDQKAQYKKSSNISANFVKVLNESLH